MAQKLLTIEEAGRALGISRATVWRRIQRGALASVRANGRRWIPAVALNHNQPVRSRGGLDDLPPFTLDHPIFRMAGAYRGRATRPGVEDKYAILAEPDLP